LAAYKSSLNIFTFWCFLKKIVTPIIG
jgi:hypothetical protein